MPTRLLTRAGLVGAGIAAALVVGELLSRAAGIQPQYGQIVPLGEARVRTVDGVDLWNERPRASEADIERAAATPDRFLILGLGDSIMYGRDFEPTYLQQMQSTIDARTGETIEVLNLAVPGYNTTQEAAVFKEIEPRIKPDLVILHFWGNDFRQSRVVGRYIVDYGDISSDGHFVVRALPLPAAVSDFLLLHSRLYDLLSQFVIRWKRDNEQADWAVVFNPLTDILERTRRAGARLLILASPEMDGPSPKSMGVLPRLKEFATAHGVELIDLAEWVGGRESRQVSYDGVHFNGDGHRIVGEHLAEYLLSHDLKERAASTVSKH